jgi:hypothetical protein
MRADQDSNLGKHARHRRKVADIAVDDAEQPSEAAWFVVML